MVGGLDRWAFSVYASGRQEREGGKGKGKGGKNWSELLKEG